MGILVYFIPHMSVLFDALRVQSVVYVTRDIERTLGLPVTTEGYFIISNSTPFAKAVAENHPNVLLIESNELLDTHELLIHPQVTTFIEQRVGAKLLVFKNTPHIEKICAEHNWKLLNPSANMAQKIEDKISQVEWLGELDSFLPEHKIHLLKEVWFDGTPFIVQFNRAHTGNGTILITNEKMLCDLKTQFPSRPVRVTSFISGPMFTSNNVVTPDKILVGNISYQITGQRPFTDQPFATIGNDWNLPHQLLSEHQKNKYEEIVTRIGEKMRADGWNGLFGVDSILDKNTGELFLIEINARQPASTTFESQLQKKIKNDQPDKITTFEAHVMSVLGMDLRDKKLIEVNDGAQIIIRNQNQLPLDEAGLKNISQKLIAEHFNVIPYTNTTPGSDRLRIQSEQGIMKNDKQFNEVGEKIVHLL